MVKLLLSIKAKLENVTDLEPSSDGFDYFFKVQCTNCHEIHPKIISLDRQEEHPLSGGKGGAHFVWRCSSCRRESSAKFEPNAAPTPYTADSNGQFAPFVTIECRGLEFIEFYPKGVWKCKGLESGTTFPEVDLTEGEWYDYDEKSTSPVSVSEFEAQWGRA